MKILIYKRNSLINSSGGAEKVMCNLANHFAAIGNNVLFLTRDTKKGLPFYPLNKNVLLKQHNIPFGKIRRGISKILIKIRIIDFFPYFDRDFQYSTLNQKIIKNFNPDIILATSLEDAKEIVYKQNNQAAIIVTMHSHPSYFFQNKKKIKEYIKTLTQINALQVLFPSYIGKIFAIGNIVSSCNLSTNVQSKKIICISRIEENKGQYEAIEAFAQIASKIPEWNIEFWGDIEQPQYKQKCLKLAHRHNIENRIKFCGLTNNIQEQLKKSSIGIYPSKFEGFGLALAETLAAGIPCIGFKHSAGVNQIIKNGENGYLTENTTEMSSQLLYLTKNIKQREKLGKQAKESMKEFASEIIFNKWQHLINDIQPNNKKVLPPQNFKNIPIFIISFNRLSYIEKLVSYLEKTGHTNIHIIDNHSSYPPLLEYLKKSQHTIHHMDKNYGHLVLFKATEFKKIIEHEYFVLTDPDILPTEECPDNFIEIFHNILQQYKTARKVGFSLKTDDLPDSYSLKNTVIKWEKGFYTKPIKGTTPPIYKAAIDTTFALYRPLKNKIKNEENIRVGFPYEARHLPWYQDSSQQDEETIFYNQHDLGSGNWNGTKEANYFKITEKHWKKFLGIPLVKIKKKANKTYTLLLGLIPLPKKIINKI